MSHKPETYLLEPCALERGLESSCSAHEAPELRVLAAPEEEVAHGQGARAPGFHESRGVLEGRCLLQARVQGVGDVGVGREPVASAYSRVQCDNRLETPALTHAVCASARVTWEGGGGGGGRAGVDAASRDAASLASRKQEAEGRRARGGCRAHGPAAGSSTESS